MGYRHVVFSHKLEQICYQDNPDLIFYRLLVGIDSERTTRGHLKTTANTLCGGEYA
jgi:hypothetical protein